MSNEETRLTRRDFLKVAGRTGAGAAVAVAAAAGGFEVGKVRERERLGDFKIVDMAPRFDEGKGIVAPPVLPIDRFTFEARVRLDPFGGKGPQTRYVFRQPSRDSGIDVGLFIHGGEGVGDGQTGILQAAFWDSKGPQGLSTEPVVNAGLWYHLAMVKDRGRVKLFVDGAQVASRSYDGSSPSYGSDGLVLGSEISSNLGRSLMGEMNWVRVSDNARYGDDFSPLLPMKKLEVDEHTVALWDLQGSLRDSSGHGHDVKPVNPLMEFTVVVDAS